MTADEEDGLADALPELQTLLASAYDVGHPHAWRLLHGGTNDTYLVTTTRGRYVLRHYGHAWRSVTDILYEVDLLLHLARDGVPVAIPIARTDGGFKSAVSGSEGGRYAVLFAYAPGKPPPWPPSPDYYRPYGRAAATIHAALDDFSSPHARAPLGLDHLVERPLRTILPFLAQEPDDADYLRRLADRLTERVTQVGDLLDWGACHGDFNGANCHASDDGTVTFFDFDCCGQGWRVYDLATLRWAAALNHADEIWPAFLEGYRGHRDVGEDELDMTTPFVLIRHLWWLGAHARSEAARQGRQYFDKGLAFLRAWEGKWLG